MIQKLDLDQLPPTTNHTHGRTKWGGVYMKPIGKQFMEYVALLCRQSHLMIHTGYVEIDILASAGRYKNGKPKNMDVQNVEKILFDSLQGFAYHNDTQVWKHTTTRIDSEKIFTSIIIKDYEPS